MEWDADARPEGFVRDERMGGRWHRTVDRGDLERLYRVDTWALYRGKWPVYLVEWTGLSDVYVPI